MFNKEANAEMELIGTAYDSEVITLQKWSFPKLVINEFKLIVYKVSLCFSVSLYSLSLQWTRN
jgi:hypothetical protein